MLEQLLTWLDSGPIYYWTGAWSCFAAVVALALGAFWRRRENAWWQHPAVICTAMLVTLAAFRWPELLDNRQYPDPDESQFIAGASKLRTDPVFWRSVDGTTVGPLGYWPLLAALLVRSSLDFTSARCVGLLLAWIQLLGAWLIFRHLFNARIAGLLVLPLFAMHAFTQAWSFVAYCSEHVPGALLAVGCWALFSAWRSKENETPDLARLFAAGVLIGAIPFAKLQAAPIAAVAFAAGLWFLATSGFANGKLRGFAAFVGGAAIVPVLIVAMVLTFGVWSDFFQCYLVENLRYTSGNQFPPDRSFGWSEAPSMFYQMGSAVAGFNEFEVWTVLFAIVGLFFIAHFARWPRRCVVTAAALLAAAAVAAMARGRPYLHYLQLTIFPAGLLGGAVAGALLSNPAHAASLSAPSIRLKRAIILCAFLICGLGPQIWWRVREPQPFLGFLTATSGDLVRSEVSREILRHANPGESLGIWGWMPTLWVETDLRQATRDGQTSRQIEPHPRRDYYRVRFLQDLVRAQPLVFVDAVGHGNFVYEDRAQCGHETFSDLRDYLEQNYHLVVDLDGARIYVRNDRL